MSCSLFHIPAKLICYLCVLVLCICPSIPLTVSLSPVDGYAFAAQAPASKATAKKARKKVTAKRSNTVKKKSSIKRASIPAPAFKGAILYSVNSKKILFSENANVLVPPASLTKIIAMYVAFDTIKAKRIPLTTMVTVSANAARATGSRMGLTRGEKVQLQDLLRGMAVASGNDASIAVAEFIAGSERAFVRNMNKKARQIGMKRTMFRNANGLPAPGQVTTAQDMLLLALSYMRAYPGNLATYHSHKFNAYKGRSAGVNANPLLGNFAGADGLKTGYVTAAGYNIIATALRGNQRVIAVLLGAPSSAVRAKEITALMEAGFGKYAVPVPPAKGKKKKKVAKATDNVEQKKTPAASAPKKRKQRAANPTQSAPSRNQGTGKIPQLSNYNLD